ncbi:MULTISPECIES: Bug family tripartite tricarboxylate transporter substrate binding protein [Roseomonadaceae]|uniref:Tripartite tricarboxylate transporter substrate binding protein n=1 Tax=Falsiroseomonas oleicola TaxID=2801474 RepID=A0ABS6HE13_9PROT|nr:tripartite tricarboxylate transporter substrate-binding protein [Roseomonas oleicola]MBU8546976.1 tripartite tricarboxylate transporter substrate binding protein [Roseomonas oleicola]
MSQAAQQPTRRTLLASAALLAAAPAAAQPAWKPSRDVRIICGFAPGGAGDMICRLAADSLRAQWGQSVIVETRSGAGGMISAEVCARAAPDGHTAVLATMGMLTISPNLPGMTLPIAVERDLTPIAAVAGIYKILIAYPEAPFRTVPELIARAKANPGAIAYGSSGVGSSPHLAAELFARMAGVAFTHVPYRGGAPAMTDLMAGRIAFMIGNMPDFLPQIRAGALRGVAFGGGSAAPDLPDLPLIKHWLPDYDVSNWFGFCGPGGLPPQILTAWNVALQQALADPQVRARMTASGIQILGGPVSEFQARIARDGQRWSEVIRAADIRAG